MMRNEDRRLIGAATVALLLAGPLGCGSRGPETAGGGPAGAPSSPQAGPGAPAAEGTAGTTGAGARHPSYAVHETGAAEDRGALPPGHPSITGAAAQGMGGMIPAAGTPAPGAALSWTTPKGWVEVPPANAMRRAQFRVPGAGGDGECVVFYFGAGQGGDPEANALRWADQFTRPGGGPARDALKTSRLEIAGMKVLLVEVAGTYAGGGMMGQPEPPRPGFMLLGAVAEGPDANWYFKFTGPEKTVRAQRGAFDALLKSLRKGA